MVRNDSIWKLLQATVIRGAEYAKWQRELLVQKDAYEKERQLVKETAQRISPDSTVRHGPFKGMIYPALESVGSALFPKLLGSYEQELHPLIEDLLSTDYAAIVDVGCAEGYYAIGMALRLRQARIYAYDTNARAIELCRQMARANQVEDRLVTGAFCTADTLRALPLPGRSLLICDCEGYEKELFPQDVIPVLARHDLLIEVHDFIDIELSSLLRKRFEASHTITEIQSVDDIVKARTYAYPELAVFTLSERKRILAEHRPALMTWFFMTPIQAARVSP